MKKKKIASPILVFVAMLAFALIASPANGIRENHDGLLHNRYKAMEIKYGPTDPGSIPSMGHDSSDTGHKILDRYKDMEIKLTPTTQDYIKYSPTDPGRSPGMGHGSPEMGQKILNRYKDMEIKLTPTTKDYIKLVPTAPGRSPGMGHKVVSPARKVIKAGSTREKFD